MEYTSEMIITKLKNHTKNKRKLFLLEYELLNLKQVSPYETLETMAFGKPLGEESVSSCGLKQDRMMRVALNYRDRAERQNMEARTEVLEEWQTLSIEVNRLETYLGLLDDQLSQILRCVYFEEKTWRMIEEETGLSRRTIIRRKKDAIEALIEMYSYTKNLIER